ncbi:MAG: hypothetical protein HQ542_04445, partial [Bacteroidia bacterium]|nr:hypothetical protein [Bacteroidia bacterium]
MKTSIRFLVPALCGLCMALLLTTTVRAQTLTCTFSMAEMACLEQHVKVIYTGNAPENANYIWDFDGAVILEGSGQGPIWVKWLTTGEKHVTLTVHHELQTCTHTRAILIVEQPALFQMTGGGSYPYGGTGVNVGLSGSETDVIYKLRYYWEYTGISKIGTGNLLDFGKQTEPGPY